MTVCFHLYQCGHFNRSSQCRSQFKIRGMKARGDCCCLSSSRQFSLYLLRRKYLCFGYLHQPVSKTMGLLPLRNFPFSFFFPNHSLWNDIFYFRRKWYACRFISFLRVSDASEYRSRHLTNIKVNNYRHSGDILVRVLRVWSKEASSQVVCKTSRFLTVLCALKCIVLMHYTLIGE